MADELGTKTLGELIADCMTARERLEELHHQADKSGAVEAVVKADEALELGVKTRIGLRIAQNAFLS